MVLAMMTALKPRACAPPTDILADGLKPPSSAADHRYAAAVEIGDKTARSRTSFRQVANGQGAGPTYNYRRLASDHAH